MLNLDTIQKAKKIPQTQVDSKICICGWYAGVVSDMLSSLWSWICCFVLYFLLLFFYFMGSLLHYKNNKLWNLVIMNWWFFTVVLKIIKLNKACLACEETIPQFAPKVSLDSLGLKSMSVSQCVPSQGEVTAHTTLFTTEVDQRTDTGPWATWRREGAQHKG